MKEVFEATLEKLLVDNVTQDLLVASEAEGWSRSLWEMLESSGFALAAAPEASGGAGLRWEDLFGVVQLCGRHALPLPLPEAMLANSLLGACGLDALQGSLSFAAESDLRWDGEQVSGSIAQVPWGRYVEHIVALVDGDAPRLVVLEPAAADSRTLATNIAGEARDTFSFAAHRPSLSALLPVSLNANVLTQGGAMLRSAQIAGALAAVLQIAADYANERVQFGRPIAKFQVVQHQLAVLAEHVAAARVAAQAAFAESGTATGSEMGFAPLPVMAAKICCSEAASVGASSGHGVHGAIGFTQEYHLHPHTRRLWAWRSEYGSATYWSTLLGESICQQSAENFWPCMTSGALQS